MNFVIATLDGRGKYLREEYFLRNEVTFQANLKNDRRNARSSLKFISASIPVQRKYDRRAFVIKSKNNSSVRRVAKVANCVSEN